MTDDLYRFAPVALFALDRDGFIQHANLAAAKLLAEPYETLPGRRLMDFVVEPERAAFGRFLQETFVDSATHCCAVTVRQTNAATRSVQIEAVRSLHDPVCFAAATDITKQVAEVNLLNHHYAVAVAGAGQGVWEFEPDTGRLSWDEQMYVLYGHTKATFDGSPEVWQACVHPDDRALVDGRFGELLSGRVVELFEFRIIRASDFAVRYIEANGCPVFDDHGSVRLLVGMNRDITARKRSDAALRASQERLQFVLTATPAVFYTLEAHGDFRATFVSENVRDQTGYEARCFLEDPEFWMSHIHADDAPRVRDDLAHLPASGTLLQEYRFLHADGSYRWMLDENRLVRDAQGNPVELVGYWLDITERKALEEKLRQAQKMEVVGQLAGGVAHDFNNILGAMMLNIDLLRSGQRLSGSSSPLDDLQNMTERAAKLTSQLLTFARRRAIKVALIDVNVAVTEIVRMLERVIGEQITIRLERSAKDLWVYADAAMLDQAIMNLCINARDAMPQGGVLTITTNWVDVDAEHARVIPQAVAGRFVCLSISDTGCGMTPDVLQHVFEPFFTTKEVGKGTGLGLASVHGAVHQHRGWLQVESEKDRGTTFRIFLPVAQPPALRGQAETPHAVQPARGTETILLVEDDPSVRNLATEMLRHLGYRVIAAADGPEALLLARSHMHEVQLLLTDVMLPGGMTGIELSRHLRERHPKLKVLLMTGGQLGASPSTLPDEGGAALLSKPFAQQALSDAVRRCLDK